jgi:hypothetical protein
MRRRNARQPWSEAPEPRIRVLLECGPEAAPSIVASVIERHGYEVRTCEGPGSGPCDLLADGACALVDGADVVVNMLGGRGSAVLAHVSGLRRPPAVVAEMTRPQADAAVRSGPDEPALPALHSEHVTVVHTPVNTRQLIDAIEAAAPPSS